MPAPLYERVRPQTFAEVVGQSAAIKRINCIRSQGGLSGRAYFVTGSRGTGKTSIAKLIAAECADWLIHDLSANKMTPTRLLDLEQKLAARCIDGGGQVAIINEFHALDKEAVIELLNILERIPAHVTWIFTAPTDEYEAWRERIGGDAATLVGRGVDLALARRDLANPFAEFAARSAIAAGLAAGEFAEVVRRCVALLKVERNNLRNVLSLIEAGELLA